VIAQLILATAVALANITVQAPKEKLALEVADTVASREHGLMFRTLVPSGRGMIFVFGTDGEQRFWMKNTLIPLDMIFVRSDGTITSIAANVPASKVTTSDDQVATRQGWGKYVIELRAGEAERAGLRSGVRLDLPKLEPKE
jgi:uncharacterized protein